MDLRIKWKRRSLRVLGQILAGMLFSALPCVAQEQPVIVTSLKDQAKVEEKSNGDPKVEMAGVSTSNNDRLLFLPNFMTLEKSGRLSPPLSTGGKFKLVARGSFDYVEFPWAATLAGMSQAQDHQAGYGQGMSGYSKHFGAAFADNTIQNFMVGAVLPSLLKEDPRYYRMGSGGFRRRTGYVISHVFVTRTDSGHKRFNFSEILGSALAAGICTYSYHPRADRTLSGTATVWGKQVGYFTLSTFVKEFWPEIRRNLPHKR
jgi:hypothetical protein